MNKKLIRKMLTASGGPIYEEDWSDKLEPYAASVGLAGDVVGLGTAATGVGIPVGAAIAGFANIPNLIIDGYQTARDTWRSFNDNGNSLGSAAWNGGELILDAAGLKALQYINKAAKAGVASEKYLTSTEKALDSKPWKRVGTGHGRVRARQSADHKRKYNSGRNKALEESINTLAKKGVREAQGEYFKRKLTDEMAKRGYGVAVNDAIKSANRTVRQNLGIISGVSGGTNVYHLLPKHKSGGQVRKMQTAAGGPLFPWLLNTEYVDNWKFRTTPASRSRVLSGKGVETDKQYTERRKKETTKRTWRSDAADVAHGIGEGVLALNPYTAIPYFGAKVGLDFLNGTYGWHTALNASIPLFHIAPAPVSIGTVVDNSLEDAANAGSKTARNWRVAREVKRLVNNSSNPNTGPVIIPQNQISIESSTKPKHLVPEGTYPVYRGPKFSISSIVNPNGTVNPRQAMRVQHTVAELFPGAHKMELRLENPVWHKNDPTTFHHTKNVTLSAWSLPTPEGFTKQDLMVAALGHDFGKIISGDGHAQIGADLARQVFPDLTDAQYTAIAEHMGTPKTPLGKATKAADIDNGRSVIRRSRNEINISPQELYKVLKDQELNGYYFMGHGTGRSNVNPQIIFDNGLRIKNGDIGNTTSPISLSNLSLWPHANSKEIIILPGKAESVKFDSARGRIPSDWYDGKTFQWDDNPGFEGSGFFAVLKPNATFIETEINGVPGVYTKPEAILGSYNIDTHTLKLNPRSLYEFLFNVPKLTGPSKNNIVGASYDYRMEDPKGSMDFLKQFFALLKINGKEYTLEGLRDAANVQQGLPEHIQSYLNLNTVERAVRAMRKNGYSEREILLYVDKVNEVMNKVKVGMYSDLEYNAAGALDFGGFYNNDLNFISVNKDAYLSKPNFTPNYILKHEGRHLIDYNTSMTDDVINTLEKAYDKDFLEIPKHEDAGSLKDYQHMDRERVTTNRDARDVLLTSKGKYLLNKHDFIIDSSKRGYSTDMIDFLNKIIKYTLPEDIVNAVENSNGYGKRYINYLKKNNKLTPAKIEQLRLAMIHVPSYLLPIAGGYTLYNLFNQPLQQLQYLKQGGKMNILEFLKNGSGIHIKEKNKGKFTSYCGGKVTDECILKGKNSSNPAIRKRATFADNARHFKHKEGGSIEKLEKGSWIKNSLSFLNESGLGKTLLEGGLNFLLSNSLNKSIAGATDIAKAELDKEKQEASDYALLMATKKALEMLLIDPNNPNAFGGSIVLNYIRLQLYNEYLNSINLNFANKKALLDMLSLLMLNENTSGTISGILLSGLGAVGNFLGGKKNNSSSVDVPSSTTITGTPSSSKLVITTKSGMSGTVDLWRKAMQV